MQIEPSALWVVILLVFLALAFDFMNGFHDAANSIATVVSTGVLKPGQAVLFAAFFNFLALFIFHLSVAATVGKGIVDPGAVDTHVVMGASAISAACATPRTHNGTRKAINLDIMNSCRLKGCIRHARQAWRTWIRVRERCCPRLYVYPTPIARKSDLNTNTYKQKNPIWCEWRQAYSCRP